MNKENIKRNWYKFSKNKLSVVGLIAVLTVSLAAIFANVIAPYPKHIEWFTDFENAKKPPNLQNLFGTDLMGRDILSRTIFGFRYSLLMTVVVLIFIVPVGTILGLIAGYYSGTRIDTGIMRVTDIFLAVPSLLLAMVVCAFLRPNIVNSMIAMAIAWWPWYTRLIYGLTSSIKNEYFIQAAEIMGKPAHQIMFREILPNCFSQLFTKMTLEVGWIILAGATLSFLGLGAQPPTPDLGTMVSEGYKYLPEYWWMTIFPGLAIVFTILGFNLMGDGVRDLLSAEEY